ncbi:transposase [Fulvivirgaceae bacterium BMA12]|uniref:Transposase n=1 Tax=Agaribacillus aureus TaxID=3051825 RepID=A0ABT8L6H0_9BACT|nr:transposase [Fulvivirgaceae bacterium BMA12]
MNCSRSFDNRYAPKLTGRPPLNPRVVIGALIIKHLCNLDDREIVAQITENIYMQYFLGYVYCTRDNRRWLKSKNIKLAAKPLGRPSAQAVEDHVRPGEQNPIEGKFEQAKNGYGMNRIRARLKQTSQSLIASIILVLNLVKLAGMTSLCLSFSANPN